MAVRKRNTIITRTLETLMLIAAVVAGGILPASASFHTFQINELYSNASGTVQFIELLEGSGVNGQQFLMSHPLTVTQGTTTNTYLFANDLPSSSTAGKHVLIATAGFAALGIVTPDYTIPAGFLFTNGSTVNYAGVDSVAYTALPVDGVSSLNRNGTTGLNSPTNFAGQSGTISAALPVEVPTLRDGAITALCILLLVIAGRQRSRAGR